MQSMPVYDFCAAWDFFVTVTGDSIKVKSATSDATRDTVYALLQGAEAYNAVGKPTAAQCLRSAARQTITRRYGSDDGFSACAARF